MGNSQSQVANIVNKSSMSVTNDFVSTTIVNTRASSTNMQTFTLNVGVLDHCPLSLGQKIEATTSAVATVTDTQLTTLQTSLSSTLAAALQQSTDMVNGVASMTGGNAQDVRTNIQQTIDSAIRNNINSTTINQVATDSVNMQTMTLNIAACQYSPIEANQGIVSNVIAQNILTKISTAIASSNVIAAAASNVSQDSGMHNQGLNDLVDSVFKGLTGIWGIIALVICVIVIGAVAFLLSPAGQKASETLADAGASKISGPL